MDLALLGIVFILFVILLIMVFYLYNILQQNGYAVLSLAALVERTFREYYKGQDIDIEVVGNGIDLVWKGDVKGIPSESDKGFITIYTEDSGINSPVHDLEEADILASKITTIVYDYIKERDGKL